MSTKVFLFYNYHNQMSLLQKYYKKNNNNITKNRPLCVQSLLIRPVYVCFSVFLWYLGQSANLLHNVVETLSVLLSLALVALLAAAGDNHDATRWSLGSTSAAEVLLGRNKDVGDLGVLAEDGDVGDDVAGGDVTGNDDDALVALAERLDDLLDTALDVLGLGSCK